MKYLLLLLVLTISVPPLQAGHCDMEAEPTAMHHMDHEGMTDGGMEDNDCCDSKQDDQQSGCDQTVQCGSSCMVLVSNISTVQNVGVVWGRDFSQSLAAGQLTPSHSHPPFRPPIS